MTAITAVPAASPPPVSSLVISPPETPLTTPTKPKVTFIGPPPPTTRKSPSTPKITNLCMAIANRPLEVPYGCLTKDNYQYLVQPLGKAYIQPHNYITLESLLNKSSPATLSRRQRYHIALILADSHIQLHPTPWLTSKWSKKDILFLHCPQDRTKIMDEQPYISRSLSKPFKCPPNTSSSTNALIFQDSIRNLGIMLLELCFGKAIEDHELRRNIITDNEHIMQVINYAAATEWVKDVADETGIEYQDAVNWCLHNMQESGSEERWRGDMFAGVVEKLKYCYDQFTGV